MLPQACQPRVVWPIESGLDEAENIVRLASQHLTRTSFMPMSTTCRTTDCVVEARILMSRSGFGSQKYSREKKSTGRKGTRMALISTRPAQPSKGIRLPSVSPVERSGVLVGEFDSDGVQRNDLFESPPSRVQFQVPAPGHCISNRQWRK
jgi:hypothetical protein